MKQIDTQVQPMTFPRFRYMPFISTAELEKFAPGCVNAMKSRDCHAKCEIEWRSKCPQQNATLVSGILPHNRGGSEIHTKASRAGDNAPGILTKSFWMALPAGSYLVSNIGWYPQSNFEEVVARSAAKRLAQWEKIVFNSANSRLCYVYTSKKKYDNLRAAHDAERQARWAKLAAKSAAKCAQLAT